MIKKTTLSLVFVTIMAYTANVFAQKADKIVLLAPEMNDQGKFGIKNKKNKIVVPFEYAEILVKDEGWILVKGQDENWGAYLTSGELVSTPKFQEIIVPGPESLIVKDDDAWGVLNKAGNYVEKPIYKKIAPLEQGKYSLLRFREYILLNEKKDTISKLYADSLSVIAGGMYYIERNGVKSLVDEKGMKLTYLEPKNLRRISKNAFLHYGNNKTGVVNAKGEVVIAAEYDSIFTENPNLFQAKTSINGKEAWYLFDTLGRSLYDQPFEFMDKFDGANWARAVHDNKFGYILPNGDWAIKPQYVDAKPFMGGFAAVKDDKYYGVLTSNNRWLFHPILADDIQVLHENHFIFKINKETVLIDTMGIERICLKNFKILPGGLLETRDKSKVGRIGGMGEIVPPVFDKIKDYPNDSVIFVFTKNLIGMFNLKGDTLIKPDTILSDITEFKEQLMAVKLWGRYGFIDNWGRIRISNQYVKVKSFSDDMAAVMLIGKWGYIDKAEVLRVQPYYEEALPFKNGVGIVKGSNGKYGFVNNRGKEVTALEYDAFKETGFGTYISYKGKKQGLINADGRESVYPKYDMIVPLANGNLKVMKNGKWAVLTSGDLIIHSFLYDDVLYNTDSQMYIMQSGMRYEE